MFGLFRKKRGIPPRHRSAAYMNLAYKILPTVSGAMDSTPAPLSMLTDEDKTTPITTLLSDDDAAAVYINLDLLQNFEVYEIIISDGIGGGYKSAASNTGAISLETSPDNSNWTERDTQTTVSTAYVPITLNYSGEGIDVRYVRVKMLSDGSRAQYLKPSEIEVFGC